LSPQDEIVVGQIGPVIGTHAGPRVIGVTFQTG
jgi:fatty acid-binding protein DegV